jgi:hypothetical protein
MIPGFPELMKIASGATSPIAIVAILLIVILGGGYIIYHFQQKRIDSLPEASRAKATDDYLTRYNLDANKLTKEQTTDLIRDELKTKARTTIQTRIIIALVFLIVCVTAFVSYVLTTRPAPPPPPAEVTGGFPIITCNTCRDSKIPDGLFSMASDSDTIHPWVDNLENGAVFQLGLDPSRVRRFWLITDPYQNGLEDGTAYVYVGTDKNPFVLAFLVYVDSRPARFAPLDRLQGQGPASEYIFHVPVSNSPARLVVFVAMPSDAYNEIKSDPKFQLRAAPLTWK